MRGNWEIEDAFERYLEPRVDLYAIDMHGKDI